jgi:hypothetical protein
VGLAGDSRPPKPLSGCTLNWMYPKLGLGYIVRMYPKLGESGAIVATLKRKKRQSPQTLKPASSSPLEKLSALCH